MEMKTILISVDKYYKLIRFKSLDYELTYSTPFSISSLTTFFYEILMLATSGFLFLSTSFIF